MSGVLLGTAHTCLYFKPMVRVSCNVSDMRLLPSSISREGHSLSLGLAADWEGEPPFDHDSDLTGLSLQSSEAMGVGTLGRRKQCRWAQEKPEKDELVFSVSLGTQMCFVSQRRSCR